MRRVKSYDNEGNIKEWLIFNDKEFDLVVADKNLRFIQIHDMYKYGYVFTETFRKMIGNEKPINIVEHLAYNCKTIGDLKDYVLTVNHSNELFGFYDYKNLTWFCFKNDVLYSERYVSDDMFITKSEPLTLGLDMIISTLKGYL